MRIHLILGALEEVSLPRRGNGCNAVEMSLPSVWSQVAQPFTGYGTLGKLFQYSTSASVKPGC